MQKTAGEIAELLKGKVEGDPKELITGLSSFELSKKGDITFAESKQFVEKLDATAASCVLVAEDFSGSSSKTLIKVRSPKEAFVILLASIHRPEEFEPGIHPTAVLGREVAVGKDVHIGPYAVVSDGVKIGDKTQIMAHVTIGRNTVIGSRVTIHSGVSIYYDTRIGDRVLIHSGAVIGADGFGFYELKGVHHKIPQTGNVIIEDDVEIGANDTIDRATFGSTVVGKGSKLDDGVHVAHNCRLGQNVILCGQAGVAGSTVIEDNVLIGAQAGVKDHVRLKKRSVVGATAAVKEDTEEGQFVLGMPAIEGIDFGRRHAALGKLTEKIKTLMKMIKEYEVKKGETK